MLLQLEQADLNQISRLGDHESPSLALLHELLSILSHIKDGHRILYRDNLLGTATVGTRDPLGLSEILPEAHIEWQTSLAFAEGAIAKIGKG